MIGSLKGVETQATVAAWATETFGDGGSDLSCLTRANLEMAELLHAVAIEEPREKIVREIADVVIVLYRFCARVGLDLAALAQVKAVPDGVEARDLILYASVALSKAMLEVAPGDPDKLVHEISHVATVLVIAAHVLGTRLADVIDAKMAINRARKWVVVAGHGQHVETPAVTKPEARSNACCMYAMGAEGGQACEECR